MAQKKILVINPNSSKAMTKGLDVLIQGLKTDSTNLIETYTAPSGPDSINNEDDAQVSAGIVYKDLLPNISNYNAYLVACYSVHPLVGMLRDAVPPGTHVEGIFEASISTSLLILRQSSGSASGNKLDKFGIVSTGTYWEKVLSEGVRNLMDGRESEQFKGVETTGLNAGELHTAPPELVKKKMMDATKRLVKNRDVKVICLGCAGMAGLDSIVEEALMEELGEDQAKDVVILDGVKAGIKVLEDVLRGDR